MESFDLELCFEVAMKAVNEGGEVNFFVNKKYEINKIYTKKSKTI